MLMDADWCLLMLIHVDWCWLLIDVDWYWLMLIDTDLCWFMVIGADWCSNKVQPGFLLLERTSGVSPVIFSYNKSSFYYWISDKVTFYRADPLGTAKKRTQNSLMLGGHRCEAPDETIRGSCCTPSSPCPPGAGDCDSDSDCRSGL